MGESSRQDLSVLWGAVRWPLPHRVLQTMSAISGWWVAKTEHAQKRLGTNSSSPLSRGHTAAVSHFS